MARREHRLLILDMLEAAERIQQYIDGYDQAGFEADQRTVDAVVRIVWTIASRELPLLISRLRGLVDQQC